MITIKIREESAWGKDGITLLNNIIAKAMKIAYQIDFADIPIKDDTIYVWVKKFTNKDGSIEYYPKIEIDSNNEELQLDCYPDGSIREYHFKTFNRASGGWTREDTVKSNADKMLQRVYDEVLIRV